MIYTKVVKKLLLEELKIHERGDIIFKNHNISIIAIIVAACSNPPHYFVYP